MPAATVPCGVPACCLQTCIEYGGGRAVIRARRQGPRRDAGASRCRGKHGATAPPAAPPAALPPRRTPAHAAPQSRRRSHASPCSQRRIAQRRLIVIIAACTCCQLLQKRCLTGVFPILRTVETAAGQAQPIARPLKRLKERTANISSDRSSSSWCRMPLQRQARRACAHAQSVQRVRRWGSERSIPTEAPRFPGENHGGDILHGFVECRWYPACLRRTACTRCREIDLTPESAAFPAPLETSCMRSLCAMHTKIACERVLAWERRTHRLRSHKKVRTAATLH